MQVSSPNNKKNTRLPNIATEETVEQFSEAMRGIDIAEKERQAQAEAAAENYEYINLAGFPISPETLTILTKEQAQQLQMICFYAGNNDIRIGALNPEDPDVVTVVKELNDKHHAPISLYKISQHSFNTAFKLYDNLPRIRKFVSGVEITEEDILKYEKEINTFHDLEKKLQEVTVTDMVTLILAAALKARTSDVHIEAEENDVKVRYRVDGILHDVASLKKEVWPQIATRIKLVSGLKINISKKPQDGRFTIFMSEETIDVRVSALPTTFGESVVMRLLVSSAIGLAFEELGLRGKAYEDLKLEILKPNGMIVTTGPTGSGKTTTLYAILNKLNSQETKIITIEDPVEYKLRGVNQSQVDYSREYTFANGLRSILRQDPDIVMVGEIRDLETADIAINASLTGHLVVSTLHTNDAAGTVPRLLAMGVKPFLLAPAINAMIGQRLVRRICSECKKSAELDSQAMSRVMKILNAIPENSGARIPAERFKSLQFFKGGGCEACQGLGYKGRMGIYEIMTMNKEVESMILSGRVSEYDMRAVAQKHGVISMIQDGLLKALDGITTVDEVFRVAKDIGEEL